MGACVCADVMACMARVMCVLAHNRFVYIRNVRIVRYALRSVAEDLAPLVTSLSIGDAFGQ